MKSATWCPIVRAPEPTVGRGIRVVNLSRYRTGDVARFVRAAVRAYRGPRDLTVVVTEHPRRTRGCALLGGRKLGLSLGPSASSEKGEVARILRHELAHLRGIDHDRMSADVLFSEGPAPAWAEGLPLRKAGSGAR